MGRRISVALTLAALATLLLALGAASAAAAGRSPAQASATSLPPASAPPSARVVAAPGRLVPIPASIPHEPGDMVDSRILPNLRWIAQRYPIYVTDGYSGRLPSGEHVGCDECHARGSDHYNGLAVDLVPAEPSARCDSRWAPLTALALWAEPVQGEPAPPFRWVGYDGDAGHGCGHHLHLSWNHAPAPRFGLAEWVEVFPVGPLLDPGRSKRKAPKRPAGPAGGVDGDKTGGVSSQGGGSGARAGGASASSGGASAGGG